MLSGKGYGRIIHFINTYWCQALLQMGISDKCTHGLTFWGCGERKILNLEWEMLCYINMIEQCFLSFLHQGTHRKESYSCWNQDCTCVCICIHIKIFFCPHLIRVKKKIKLILEGQSQDYSVGKSWAHLHRHTKTTPTYRAILSGKDLKTSRTTTHT